MQADNMVLGMVLSEAVKFLLSVKQFYSIT